MFSWYLTCSQNNRVLIFDVSIHVIGDRISDKIYTDVQSNHYCSRRLNSTHQMGCSSNLGGNQGVVWILESKQDLDHVLKSGPTPPYVVITHRDYYTRENILNFKSNLDRVAGVVLIEGAKDSFDPAPFSPDDTCPNRYSGLYVNDTRYKDCKTNSWQQESPVSGLLYDDIPFPIFFMNETESIHNIKSCFEQNNLAKGGKRKQDTYPLCSMQLDSFMLAAGDTRTCINSHSLVDDLLQTSGRRCYTIDNQNIFAFYKTAEGPLHAINETGTLRRPDVVEPQSLILLIAKLSSLSMFTELSPGADSTVTSIVTMLAIADALAEVRNNTDVTGSSRNIAFAFLDSEPFDYTGSSRMVYSMQDNGFPNRYFNVMADLTNLTGMQNVNLSSIDYVINLDQLANYPQSEEMFVHTDPDYADSVKRKRVLDVMKRVAKREDIKLSAEDSDLPLPPAPVHQFIMGSRQLAGSAKPLGLVISNYGKKYKNLLYNSIYDDSRNVYQATKEKLVQHLTRVGNLVAKSLYEIAFDNANTDGISVKKGIVEELIDCYLFNAECSLFTKAWQAGQQLPSGPIQTYKDPIKQSDDMNGAITAHLLAYFVGDRLHEYNITQCYDENKRSLTYNYQYVNGKDQPIKDGSTGVCVRSQMLMTPSTSPSYRITEDSILVDDSYPAWTVSLNGIRTPARLFLKPSPSQEWCIFLIGIVVTMMSFAVVLQIRGSISRLNGEADTPIGTST